MARVAHWTAVFMSCPAASALKAPCAAAWHAPAGAPDLFAHANHSAYDLSSGLGPWYTGSAARFCSTTSQDEVFGVPAAGVAVIARAVGAGAGASAAAGGAGAGWDARTGSPYGLPAPGSGFAVPGCDAVGWGAHAGTLMPCHWVGASGSGFSAARGAFGAQLGIAGLAGTNGDAGAVVAGVAGCAAHTGVPAAGEAGSTAV